MKPALLVVDVQKAFFARDPVTIRSLEEAIEWKTTSSQVKQASRCQTTLMSSTQTSTSTRPTGMPSTRPSSTPSCRGSAWTPSSSTGFCAEYCVLATYRGAEDLDLTPVLLRGALASGSLENIAFVESVSDVISYGALKRVLE